MRGLRLEFERIAVVLWLLGDHLLDEWMAAWFFGYGLAVWVGELVRNTGFDGSAWWDGGKVAR